MACQKQDVDWSADQTPSLIRLQTLTKQKLLKSAWDVQGPSQPTTDNPPLTHQAK